MIKSPCSREENGARIDCEQRCVGCRITCEKWKAYEKKVDEIRNKMNVDRMLNEMQRERCHKKGANSLERLVRKLYGHNH